MIQLQTTASRRLIVILLFALCAVISVRGLSASDEIAFITTSDYFTGSSSTISLDGSHAVVQDVASVYSDAVARYHNGLFYVVNREGADNIQILDPSDNFSTVRQFSVGSSSNPTDIVVISGTKAYVTRYDSTELWIVNPSTGTKTGAIDMSGFADSDGIPEMDQMCLFGDFLFITIQRIDRDNYWVPVGTSYIAVVDVAADTLVDTDLFTPGLQAITLTKTNPWSSLQLNPYTGMLYVSCVGYWGLQDGGVEIIDPILFQSEGIMMTESTAGGDIFDVEIVGPEKGYLIIVDASFYQELLSFNPVTGSIINTIYSPGDYVLNDIELAPTGELYLADRKPTNPGIRLYNIATDTEITTNPIDVGLPPVDITFSYNLPSAIELTAPSSTSLGRSYPNPFNPSTTIPFTLERGSDVDLSIYDVSGRLVRTLLHGRRSAGGQKARWDGRDNSGGIVPSGVYFVRLKADGLAASQKLLFLK